MSIDEQTKLLQSHHGEKLKDLYDAYDCYSDEVENYMLKDIRLDLIKAGGPDLAEADIWELLHRIDEELYLVV